MGSGEKTCLAGMGASEGDAVRHLIPVFSWGRAGSGADFKLRQRRQRITNVWGVDMVGSGWRDFQENFACMVSPHH